MWVKGSGSDLATMGAEHFTGLRMDEMLPLMERSEMSDEDMVAYLARCQLDPKMPRASIETLLHAFVPAPHVHHTHPDGINVLAGTADGERLVQECFGDSAAWIPYIRPGFTLSRQVGEAARANPDLKLVVLAKHGLVVWGDSAEEAYKRTIEVINQAVAFVNERTGDTPRFGGRHPAADRARPELLRELLPAIRGAVSSEKHKLLTLDTSDALGRVRLLRRGRAPRHRRRALPRPPRAHQARAAVDPLRPRRRRRRRAARAHRRARGGVPRRLPRVRRGARRRHDRARRPRPADRAGPAPRARLHRHDDEELDRLARPLPPRHRGDGGRPGARRVRLARRRRELRDRVLAARALQARPGAAAGRAPGPGRARDRRRRRHRPRDRRLARRRGRLRGRVRPRPVRRRGRGRGLRGQRARGQRRRHQRGRRSQPPSPPPSTASAASTSSSRTPASPPARRSRRRRSTSGTATTASS